MGNKYNDWANSLNQLVEDYEDHHNVSEVQTDIRRLEGASGQALTSGLVKIEKHYDHFFGIAKKNAAIANDWINNHRGEALTQRVADARGETDYCAPVIKVLNAVKAELVKDIAASQAAFASEGTGKAPNWDASPSTQPGAASDAHVEQRPAYKK